MNRNIDRVLLIIYFEHGLCVCVLYTCTTHAQISWKVHLLGSQDATMSGNIEGGRQVCLVSSPAPGVSLAGSSAVLTQSLSLNQRKVV